MSLRIKTSDIKMSLRIKTSDNQKGGNKTKY